MNTEKRDLSEHGERPGARVSFWRRLLVVLALAISLGLLGLALIHILGLPQHVFIGLPGTFVAIFVVTCREPETIRHLGIMAAVSLVAGVLAMLVNVPFWVLSENLLVRLLGVGFTTGFGVLIALLACRHLGLVTAQVPPESKT